MGNVCRLGKNKDELVLARCFGGYGLPSVKLSDNCFNFLLSSMKRLMAQPETMRKFSLRVNYTCFELGLRCRAVSELVGGRLDSPLKRLKNIGL